jgi:hypothetical protein
LPLSSLCIRFAKHAALPFQRFHGKFDFTPVKHRESGFAACCVHYVYGEFQ